MSVALTTVLDGLPALKPVSYKVWLAVTGKEPEWEECETCEGLGRVCCSQCTGAGCFECCRVGRVYCGPCDGKGYIDRTREEYDLRLLEATPCSGNR